MQSELLDFEKSWVEKALSPYLYLPANESRAPTELDQVHPW